MNRREEQEKAWGDAVYDVWRSGGDSDAVSRDEIADVYYGDGGCDRYATAAIVTQRVLRRDHPSPAPEAETE